MGKSQPRPRQPPTTTHERVHTRARASTHTNADSMPGTMNCVAVHACGRKLAAATSSTTGVASGRQSRGASANLFVHGPQRRRNAGHNAHAPAAAQHGHEYGRGGHAKCAGAAAEVTVVVRVVLLLSSLLLMRMMLLLWMLTVLMAPAPCQRVVVAAAAAVTAVILTVKMQHQRTPATLKLLSVASIHRRSQQQ